jgi:hypothetical protein
MYVLYAGLIHTLHFSPFYLSPLPMVILTGLKILYPFVYRKYISHSHLLNFFYPPSLVCDLPWCNLFILEL